MGLRYRHNHVLSVIVAMFLRVLFVIGAIFSFKENKEAKSAIETDGNVKNKNEMCYD